MNTKVYNKKSVLNSPIIGIYINGTTQRYKPAESKIMTPWVAYLNYAQSSAKYPNPQCKRTNRKNLNKLWKYTISPQAQKTIPQSFAGKILVPYPVESAFSNARNTIGKTQALWSQNNISHSKPSKTNLVMLYFDAVEWQCNVFVNGKKTRTHVDVYEPFSLNRIPSFGKGKQQLNAFRVWDSTNQGFQARKKKVQNPESICYALIAGNYQTVFAKTLPATYVVSAKQTSNISVEKCFVKMLPNNN